MTPTDPKVIAKAIRDFQRFRNLERRVDPYSNPAYGFNMPFGDTLKIEREMNMLRGRSNPLWLLEQLFGVSTDEPYDTDPSRTISGPHSR